MHVQNGLQKKVEKSRKQKKERRNRARKIRGVKKAAGTYSGRVGGCMGSAFCMP